MLALRIPLTAGSGALVTLGVFWMLWRFVSVPVDVGEATIVDRIDFSRQIAETLTESKREPKIERKPPPIIEPRPGLTQMVSDGPSTTFTRTRVEIAKISRGGITVGVDREPIPVVRIAPEYPPRELTNGTEGWVQVQFTITPAGTVKNAIVVAADPKNKFDAAALAAIGRWRYNPKIEGGVPVERVGLQTVIRFQLQQ